MASSAKGAPGARAIPAWALVAIAFATFAAAQFALSHDYLFHGGLFTDDWSHASTHHFGGIPQLLRELTDANTQRPLGSLYLALTVAASGTDPELHALWASICHVVAVTSIFLFARALRMATWAAATLAGLVLAFPFSDSIWLWHAASHSSVAIAIACAGGMLALRGLRAERSWPWHLAATGAFAASILTYQVVTVTVLLMLAVYLPRTDRRRAFVLWAKDLATVALASWVPAQIAGHRGTSASPLISLDEVRRHAELMAEQGVELLARALVPFGAPSAALVVAIAAAIIGGGALQALRARGGAAAHARHWLGWALAGIGIVVTAYAIYVPAITEFYVPLAGGSDNRVNALAGVGYCLIALALAMLLAGMILAATGRNDGGERPGLRWAAPLATLMLLPLAIGYARQVDEDIGAWNRASDLQQEQLAQLERTGRQPPRSTNYVYGGVGETADGVYAFRVSWDLHNATRLLWDDYSLRAFPIFEGTRIHCFDGYLFPTGPANGIGPDQGTYFPNVYLTDLRTGERTRIDSLARCRRAVREFEPGPVRG